MKRFRLGIVVFVPLVAGLLFAAGCGNKEEKKEGDVENAGGGGGGKEKKAGASAGGQEGYKPTGEVESTGWGTLKGRVTYNGTPPEETSLPIDKNKDVCESKPAKERGDTNEQTWKVGSPDHGVGDVVVWLRAPKGKYFKIPDDLKEIKDNVVIDQPFCAFEPHVVVLFPSFYDAASKAQKPTGQALEVKNSASIAHNTKLEPVNSTLNSGDNFLLDPGKARQEPLVFKPCKDNQAGGEQQVNISCNIHGWMRSYAWVLDHPYSTVTKGDNKTDKDFGAYEIKKAPAGVELEMVYWHDSLQSPQVLQTVKLDDGKETVVDFKIPK